MPLNPTPPNPTPYSSEYNSLCVGVGGVYVPAMESMDDKGRYGPLAALVFGALCISLAPVYVKWIGMDRMGPTVIAFWRTLFGAATLFLIALLRGKTLSIPRRLIKFAVLAGFVFCCDLSSWHRSVFYAGAGMSTILANTQVFGSAILSWFFFKERLSWKFFAAAVSAILGVVLLVGVLSDDVVFTTRYFHGVTLGLFAGLCYASYIITLKAASHRERIPDVVAFMGWVALSCAFFLGLASLIVGETMMPPDTSSWLLLIALGITAQALGWWAITSALAKIDASRAGLILLLQPTLAMIWGIIFFAEQLSIVQVLGAAITLAAIYYGGVKK